MGHPEDVTVVRYSTVVQLALARDLGVKAIIYSARGAFNPFVELSVAVIESE